MQEPFRLLNHVDYYRSLKDVWQFAVWDDYFHYYFINLTRSPTDFLCITDPFVPEIIKNASLEQQTADTLLANQCSKMHCLYYSQLSSPETFPHFLNPSYTGSLTIGIDPWYIYIYTFSKCRAFKLMYLVCPGLDTIRNVYILGSTSTGRSCSSLGCLCHTQPARQSM